MRVEFKNDELRLLARDATYSMGLPHHVAAAFRRRVQFIIAAPDERSLYAMRGSLDYKKLRGESDGLRQMRLNQQYRIRLEIVDRDGARVINILDVGDFHD